MRSLHLCAGHGGGLLADLILGHTIVGAVERDQFAQRVLRARQADGFLPPFPIHDDVRTFDGSPWRGTVDIVAGGIPCQGFSGAGKGLGEFDPRNLWPDAYRILKEIRAPWFFLENVANLTSFDYWGVILQDLAAAGYDARWCVLSAGDVGAPHLRKRIWLLATDTDSFAVRIPTKSRSAAEAEPCRDRQTVADANANGCGSGTIEGLHNKKHNAEPRGGALADTHGDVANRGTGNVQVGRSEGEGPSTEDRPRRDEQTTEPDLGRMADGLAGRVDQPGWWAVERGLPRVAGKQPHRADRLRGCGNGQVALCAAAAWRILKGI